MPSYIEALGDNVLDSYLRQKLTTANNARPGDPQAAINSFLRKEAMPASTITVMTFVKSLLVYTDDEEYVCGGILTLLNAPAFEDLASALFPREKFDNVLANKPTDFPPEVTPQILNQVRTKILDDRPLVVMLVIVRENRFSLEERHRCIIDCLLTVMLRDEIELSSPELLAAVNRSFSLVVENEEQQVTHEELLLAIQFVKSLKILSGLVEDPEDVPRLYDSNYRSLRNITAQSKDNFKNQLVTAGSTPENALKIHDCAERVDCWNEHLWLALMNARRADFAFESSSVNRKGLKSDGDPPQSSNNLTDIFRLEDVAGEECCSITSLSAYFADLLNLLSNTGSMKQSSTVTDLSVSEIEGNLLELLSARRPDLRKLELTCANSETLITQLSLVNEVLESFIRYKNQDLLPPPAPDQLQSIHAFNTPVDIGQGGATEGDSSGSIYRPGNTDHEVYSKVISQQLFPFTCFPYDQARDVVIQYFNAFQVPYPEFIKTFQAPELILQMVPPEVRSSVTEEVQRSLVRGADEVLERQWAAEALDLQQMEFVAITGETFFPMWLADILKGLSSDMKDIVTGLAEWESHLLWGYKDEETMLDHTDGLGLSFIKRQLMERSGLEFQDILDLIKTQHFGKQLVITNESGSNIFSESIEDLRVFSSASEPPFQPLTPNLCRNLQSFLRLKAKLKWSTKDLDAAIYCLSCREMENSPSFKSSAVFELSHISVYVVKEIASIVQLSNICGIESASLVPLWGPIDSYGESSLLHRKFLRPALGPVFAVPKDGEYFQPDGTKYQIQSCGTSICASLRWPFEYFGDLLKATSLLDAYLSIETFSTLYRYVTITQILSVPPKECLRFFELFFIEGREEALTSPKATLAAIKKWKILLNKDWTIESLLEVIGATNSSSNTSITGKAGLQLITGLLEGTAQLKNSLSSLFTEDIPTSEIVLECTARTFDAPTAKVVFEFIEGTQVFTDTATLESKENLEELMRLSTTWPEKISVIPSIENDTAYSAKFTLSGVLNEEERKQIIDDSKELPAANVALLGLIENSLLPCTIIKSRFENSVENKSKFSKNILLGDWAPSQLNKNVSTAVHPSPYSFSQLSSIETENEIRARRAAFVDLAAPTIIQDLLTVLILNAVREFVPNIDVSIISTLLSETVKVPTKENDGTESAMTALKYLIGPVEVTSAETLDVYFTPKTTDDFIMHYIDILDASSEKNPPNLTINGLQMPFDIVSKTWSAFRMTAGQAYLLRGGFSSSQLSWSTKRSMVTPFTDEELLVTVTVRRAALILDAIRRVASICEILELTIAELEYINRQVHTELNILAINLNSPSLEDLIRLQYYRELRDESIFYKSESNPISLFSWLSSSSGASVEVLASKISASTGWKDTLVEAAMIEKYPGYTPEGLVTCLRDLDALLGLKTIVKFQERLGSISNTNSKPPLAELFKIAQPSPTLSSGDVYSEAAQSLQARMTASQREHSDEGLMGNQRQALVTYLLQQKYIREDLNIWDADGLFEYFLIDVQIGPQMTTSRIKQAISVVQLFVSRCLLGLEEGVSKAALQREQWDWMQQYTLWEAHRKIFIYPENWIEPALRDDKSELFDQFETTLMQKDLSINTFVQAMQTYIYNLNEISSLDIAAYVHEPHAETADVFHFFGRTRTAPYDFYYRTVKIFRTSEVFWEPWTKIDMDISSVEAEWEGRRLENTGAYLLPIIIGGRLYLFLPSIMPKTIAKDGSSLADVGSFDDLRTKKPNIAQPEYIWEISMTWTELVKGSWSPKRVSSGSLSVGLSATVSQFRIDPVFDGKRMTIHVSYSEVGKTMIEAIGSFIFCVDQISTAIFAVPAKETLLPTCFQKTVGKGFDPSSLLTGDKYKNEQALIWVPSQLTEQGKAKDDMTWTLSKMPMRITGLVVCTKNSDGTNTSYFNLPRTALLPTDGKEWTKQSLKDNMELVLLDHTFSDELMEAAVDRIDPLQRVYNKLAQLPPTQLRESFGAGSNGAWYHELGRPTAIYNWEIGLHTVLMAVDRFSATQQYDEALQVARLVFDPSADIEVEINEGGKIIHYRTSWRFPPFQEMARRIATEGEDSFDPIDLVDLSKEIELAITERRAYGGLVHAAARGRPVSYMKWIVIKYAEIILASGDIHFRRATSESLPLATQKYIEAARVLGPEPPKIPDLAKRKLKALTFEQLREEDIAFDDVSFELGLPFSAKLQRGAAEGNRDPKKENLLCFLKTGYFAIPMNPRFKQVRSLVHERLFNLRNSLDIQGRPISYPLRDPPIDPGVLIALSKQGVSTSDILGMVSGGQDSPLTRHRFDALLNPALKLCTEVRLLGEHLLTAIEKKDAEDLSVLGAQHSIAIQQMMLGIKHTQLEEAEQTVESLLMNRSTLEAQLDYYLKLIGEPDSKIPKIKDNGSQDDWVDIQQSVDMPSQDELRMSSYERTEMKLSEDANIAYGVAAGIGAIASPIFAIPSVQGNAQPLGCGASVTTGGADIANGILAASAAMKEASTTVANIAARADKKASLTLQLQERRLQANTRGREIKLIDKQVEIQKIRITSVQKDIDLQMSEVEDAVQTEVWYRTKYTNSQLYSWMEKSLKNLYFQAYELAMTTAVRAESALTFEAGRRSSIIRQGGYWDASHDGLFAADHLYWDLKRLETAQQERAPVDYNVTKTVSLKNIDPVALMNLRIKGSTEILLNEILYDMDFPGHYMRRIRSVSMSIPATLREHDGINATLTLLEHRYRVSQSAVDYASQSAGSEAFRTDRIPISSIAISSDSQESGVFDLDFSGPRYMPFEGAGAISRWRLEFPAPVPKFDYESITDVLFKIQYTAYEGGAGLRAAASEAVIQATKATEIEGQQLGFWAMWDLKNEFSNEWDIFSTELLSDTGSTDSESATTQSVGYTGGVK